LFCALQHKKRPSLTTNYRTVIRKITLKITLHRNIIDQNKPFLQKSQNTTSNTQKNTDNYSRLVTKLSVQGLIFG